MSDGLITSDLIRAELNCRYIYLSIYLFIYLFFAWWCLIDKTLLCLEALFVNETLQAFVCLSVWWCVYRYVCMCVYVCAYVCVDVCVSASGTPLTGDGVWWWPAVWLSISTSPGPSGEGRYTTLSTQAGQAFIFVLIGISASSSIVNIHRVIWVVWERSLATDWIVMEVLSKLELFGVLKRTLKKSYTQRVIFGVFLL